MRSVLVAPNAFKGTLTSLEAASAMCAAVAVVYPDADIVTRPLADGGDGSVDALLTAGYARVNVPVRFPDGAVGTAPIAQRDREFVVELANTCGLALTRPQDRRPMTSSTIALANAVKGALDAGAERIVICAGGSASTDGGIGLVCGLGGRVLDADGNDVRPGGAWLRQITSIDLSGLDRRLLSIEIAVATDVSSPLYGPDGAATIFGPQKGATSGQVAMLDGGLRSWANVVAAHIGRDASCDSGAGAAGGTAFGALTLLGATLIPGADFITRAIGLDPALDGADLLITGEGSLDDQSLLGKGAVHAARRAIQHHVPTVMVCGQLDMAPSTLRELGVVASGALLDIATPDEAMGNAPALLVRRVIEVLAAVRAGTP